MRQIYIIAFFLMPFVAYSQLYVKPHQNKESYVYVQNELLYVEKHINLSINPSEEPRASIYLRDESQLLQGNTSGFNTGNGFLSIFQEGVATAYTYNYWSLPVRNSQANPLLSSFLFDPVDKTNSQRIILTQELNGEAYPLKISSRWLYKLSGEGYSDWIFLGNNFNLKPGEGFTMKGVNGTNLNTVIHGVANNPGNNQRYDFRGIPNNGEIILPIKENQILLIGNPYPSSMDLNLFLEENLSTSGIAYFWDSKFIDSHYLTDYEGGYGAYSPAGGNNGYVPAAFSKYDRNGNIVQEHGHRGNHYARHFTPIAQGFIVEGVKDGYISFKNKYRQFVPENPSTSQFKSSYKQQGIPIDLTRLRLNIIFGDKFIRQLLIFHHSASTTGIDHAMDARNLMPLKSDAGWEINGQEFLINVRPLDLYDQIPLSLYLAEEQEISIALEEQNNLEAGIYIFDAETKEYYDLRRSNFEKMIRSGSHNERFFLTFWDASKIEDEPTAGLISPPVAINDYSIFQNNPFHRLEITAPLRKTPDKIELFDITGRKLREQKGRKEQGYYEFYTRNLSRGLYIVKITGLEGAVIYKKVLISN